MPFMQGNNAGNPGGTQGPGVQNLLDPNLMQMTQQ